MQNLAMIVFLLFFNIVYSAAASGCSCTLDLMQLLIRHDRTLLSAGAVKSSVFSVSERAGNVYGLDIYLFTPEFSTLSFRMSRFSDV